jgi:hypothetical protein
MNPLRSISGMLDGDLHAFTRATDECGNEEIECVCLCGRSARQVQLLVDDRPGLLWVSNCSNELLIASLSLVTRRDNMTSLLRPTSSIGARIAAEPKVALSPSKPWSAALTACGPRIG